MTYTALHSKPNGTYTVAELQKAREMQRKIK